MAMVRTIAYACDICGTELIVTESGVGYLSPIYCCGIEIKETAIPAKKMASSKTPKKKTTAKKKVVAKKKPTSKKKR